MKVGNIIGHPPVPFSYEGDDVWVAPKLKIGIEIELENPSRSNFDLTSLLPWWRHQQDGSLRDSGFELSLENPLFGKDLTRSVDAMEKLFIKYEKLIQLNYRTGLHIHMDIRNMEMEELKRLFLLYIMFERPIFNFIGDNRNQNNFCAPWFRISDHLESLFTAFDPNQNSRYVSQIFGNIERYSALNCNAVSKFGSIEFRHMQMTRDFNKIRNWINVIMSLYVHSSTGGSCGPQMSTEGIIDEISKGGALEVARRIFPEWFIQYMDEKSIWEGILLMQELSVNTSQKLTFADSNPVKKICPHNASKYVGYLRFVNSKKETR